MRSNSHSQEEEEVQFRSTETDMVFRAPAATDVEACGAHAASPPPPSPAPSISDTEASGEEAVKRKPALPPYKKLDVELGPPPAYESLEAKSK